jgi:hypothetical protein
MQATWVGIPECESYDKSIDDSALGRALMDGRERFAARDGSDTVCGCKLLLKEGDLLDECAAFLPQSAS